MIEGEKVIDAKCPYITVDAIIEVGKKIVLIERKNPPLGYAFPGGFVDYGESLEDAVVREVKEETGLHFLITSQLKAYSNPNRDPRAHIITVAFWGRAAAIPVAADDAKKAFLISPGQALNKVLIADHRQILLDYMQVR